MPENVLLTGAPGVGKTTLIRRVVERLDRPAGGFYTQEVREKGRRVGFLLVTLEGQQAILAHVTIASRQRVGLYGVDVAALDRIGVPAIRQAIQAEAVVVIDEIGKMELFSEAFREAVLEALDSPNPVLGTIMQRQHPWADAIKARTDVQVIQVTRQNRDRLVDRLVAWLQGQVPWPADS